MSSGQRFDERLARRGGWVEGLRAPAWLYGLCVRARGALYDQRWWPRERLEAAVVCVGNLTAGGTGKTPMVVWVARELARRGRRVGLLSRGYGGAGHANDEARMLAELLPQLPHVQDAERARGGRRLLELGCDAIVMDDGFQHRRLARDLDLILIDATRPWGLPARDGREPVRALLPRGLLREPPRALNRAQAIVLTRCDQLEPAALEALEAELARSAPGLPIARSQHRALALRDARGQRRPLGELAGREVDLLSAIGNPEAFERSVRALGARVRTHRRCADHHLFTPAELAGLGADGRWLIVTHKDLVKLGQLAPHALALEIELVFTSPIGALEALLDSLPLARTQRERAALHAGLHG